MNEHATPPAQDESLRGTGRTLRTILRVLASEESETALVCDRPNVATLLCDAAFQTAQELGMPATSKRRDSFTIDGRIIRFLPFGDARKYSGITVAYADHEDTPWRIRPMTPHEAHDRFTACVREIMESGVEIRGLNVSAVEFYPPGTPPFVPQAGGEDDEYSCVRIEVAGGEWYWRILDPEGVCFASCWTERGADAIVSALNTARASMRIAIAVDRQLRDHPDFRRLEQDSLYPHTSAPLPTLTPTGPTPVGSATHTGDVCAKCGSGNLTWSGTCKTCLSCGDAGGCG